MALPSGVKAQDFTLTSTTGKPVVLSELTKRGPVVLAFFKVSCPTCQYAFPFLERLFHAYKNQGVTLIGVSQNPAEDTAAFVKEYRVTFPIALDDTRKFAVSNAYGLTNVPTLFWVEPDGEIEITSVGWNKAEFEKINQRMAESGKLSVVMPFRSGEEVRDFRAG